MLVLVVSNHQREYSLSCDVKSLSVTEPYGPSTTSNLSRLGRNKSINYTLGCLEIITKDCLSPYQPPSPCQPSPYQSDNCCCPVSSSITVPVSGIHESANKGKHHPTIKLGIGSLWFPSLLNRILLELDKYMWVRWWKLPSTRHKPRSISAFGSVWGVFHERLNSLFASYSSFLDD